MKRILVIAITLAIVGGTINDVGRYATALYYLDQSTVDVAETASSAAKGGTRDIAGRAAMQTAATHDLELYGYDQDSTTVHVWTRKKVTGTMFYGPVKALMSRQPWDTPFTVADDAKAYID